jgi:hypothetical protein
VKSSPDTIRLATSGYPFKAKYMMSRDGSRTIRRETFLYSTLQARTSDAFLAFHPGTSWRLLPQFLVGTLFGTFNNTALYIPKSGLQCTITCGVSRNGIPFTSATISVSSNPVRVSTTVLKFS